MVSNAIKFSPTNGKVTIRVFFNPPLLEKEAAHAHVSHSSHRSEGRVTSGFSDYNHDHELSTDKAITNSKSGKRTGGIVDKLGSAMHRISITSSSDSHHLSILRSTDRSLCSIAVDNDEDIAPVVGIVGGGVAHRSNPTPHQPLYSEDASQKSMATDELDMLAHQKKLHGERTEGHLIIVISDSGPGISDVNQKKLFRGVIQFDPEKNQGGGGSGFGLFISKGIVDLHNGTIAVHSEGEGHGCSFILSIPMPMIQAESDILAESEATVSSAQHLHNDRHFVSVKSEGDLVKTGTSHPMTPSALMNPSTTTNVTNGPGLDPDSPPKGSPGNISNSPSNDQKMRRITMVDMGLAYSSKLMNRGNSNLINTSSHGNIFNVGNTSSHGNISNVGNTSNEFPLQVTLVSTRLLTPRQNGRNDSSRQRPHSPLRLRKYRLLIVDDSGLSRKMTCKAMRAAGHECEEAADGLIALNKVKEKLAAVPVFLDQDQDGGGGSAVKSMMYDAVLMDTNMPVQPPRTDYY